MNPPIHVTFVGALLALVFTASMLSLITWMLRVPPQLSQIVAKVRCSYGAIKTILVPINGTFYSEKAIELACRIGKEQQSEVILAYVMEIPMTSPLNVNIPEVQAKAKEILDSGVQLISLHKLSYQTRIQRARAAGTGIIQAAKDHQADLIVIGIKPRLYGESPGIIGSTAYWLLKNSPCEIIIDKLPCMVV